MKIKFIKYCLLDCGKVTFTKHLPTLVLEISHNEHPHSSLGDYSPIEFKNRKIA
jgi:hypothetical protein